MAEIRVSCAAADDGWTCDVAVEDGAMQTRHRVAFRRADLARLAPGATEPDDLVRRSFEFLLERESAQSILRSFDLLAIGRYFPEYETELRRRP